MVPPVSYGDGISDAKCVVSGLQMDYRRFQNQAQLACYTNERDAIRAYDAATPITTNLMGTFKDLDYFEWAKEMDVVSWDNYPGMDTPPSFTAMCHDLMRGIGVVTWQDASDATEYARASRRTLYWSQVLNSIEDRLDSDMTAKRRILAFEIGTFFTRYVVFEDGRMGIPGTIATPVDSVESFYQALAHIVNGQRAPLDGIAMSVPGFIDVSKQVAVTAGALGMLYKHEIGKELQEYLDKPVPTWMENDANCAAMAEKLSGNAVKLDDFALITIDTGIGGALFLDGRIRRGKDWRAGELGMMIPNYETGGFNTMQNYLSTIVLAEGYAKEFDVPTGSIVPATLFRRLDEPRVRKIVDEWIDYLAIAIFNTAAATDPECILLGGGICREQQLLPMVNAALDRIPQWGDFRTSVKRCRHTNNAGLIGAYYAFETEVGGLTDVPIR